MTTGIARQLDLLEATGLLRPVASAPDLEYLFRHALVQDAAYDSLLRQDRRRLHRAVGETLEQLHAQHLSEIAPELALHFQAAGDAGRARQYYAEAGAAALARAANREAESYYRAALDLAPPPAEAAPLWRGLEAALLWQNRPHEQAAAGRAAVALYAAAGDRDMVGRLYFEMIRGAFLGSNVGLMVALLEDGRVALADTPDSVGLALFLTSLGHAQIQTGQIDQARQTLFRALDLADRFGETEAEIEILCSLATHVGLPLSEREALMEKAVALTDPDRPSLSSSWAYNNRGILLRELDGRWHDAVPYHQAGLRIAHQIGAGMGECWSYGSWADALLTGGDLAGAEAVLRQMQMLPTQADDSFLAQRMAERLQFQLARYQHGPAARPLLEGIFAAESGASNELLGRGVGPLLADLLLEMDQPAAAEAILAAQLPGEEQRRNPTVGIRALLLAAYAHQGRIAEATAVLAAAEAEAGSPPRPPDVVALNLAAARLALARGDGPTAGAAFAATVAQAAHLQMRWQQARALWEWGRAELAGAVPGGAEVARAHLAAAHALFAAVPAPYYAAATREF